MVWCSIKDGCTNIVKLVMALMQDLNALCNSQQNF
jgi:hypothetical protein